MFVLSILLLVRIPLALGLCEEACRPIVSLLSSCSLPPLSTDFETLEEPEERNFAEFPPTSSWTAGPITHVIANYSEAECFCTDGRFEFKACHQCFERDQHLNNNPTHNDKRVHNFYRWDCKEFGYYVNATLSYPSTTRTSMPFPTQAPDEEDDREDQGEPDEGQDDDCEDICAVVRGQIRSCGLTPLGSEEPPLTTVPNGISDYYGTVLLNRTAAECMCTLPVIRRLHGCDWCLAGESDPNLSGRVFDYQFDCNSFGYYTDSKTVIPEEEDLSGGGEDGEGDEGADPTSVNPSSLPFPTTIADSGGDRAGHKSIELISAAIFSWLLLFVH